MGFEALKNIIDWNKEQAILHPQDEDLENNLCPFDAWPLDMDTEGHKSCKVCGRIWNY